MKNVGVIGSGTMGNGIAHVFAQNGYNVHLIDIKQDALDRALQVIAKNFDRQIAKGKISEDVKTDSLNRIETFTNVLTGVAGCDLVVEAATERLIRASMLTKEMQKNSKLLTDKFARGVHDMLSNGPAGDAFRSAFGAKDAAAQFKYMRRFGSASPTSRSSDHLQDLIAESVNCLGVGTTEDMSGKVVEGNVHIVNSNDNNDANDSGNNDGTDSDNSHSNIDNSNIEI